MQKPLSMNRESTEYYENKLKEIEKSLKLTEIGMGTYQIAPVLSLTTLPESPRHSKRPSEAKKPSCATTPIIPTPTSTSLSLQELTMKTPHPTLSLELVSCQEDCLNNEETSVDQDQDSFIPSHIPQDLVPPSQEPHSPPSPM